MIKGLGKTSPTHSNVHSKTRQILILNHSKDPSDEPTSRVIPLVISNSGLITNSSHRDISMAELEPNLVSRTGTAKRPKGKVTFKKKQSDRGLILSLSKRELVDVNTNFLDTPDGTLDNAD